MPIEPSNVPAVKIRPPMTIGDKGDPSRSIVKDADRIFALIEDERHLVAQDLYRDVVRRLDDWNYQRQEEARKHPKQRFFRGNRKDRERKEKEDAGFQKVQELFEKEKAAIEKLENRCRLFRKAQQNLNIDETWLFASHHFGIKTYYRREEDESLSIKLEGDISGVPLFEQLAVFREVDLHCKWVPFCTSSMLVADLDKLDTVGWFMTGVPQLGLARDGCFRVIGCDNLSKNGSVIVTGQGIQDRKPHHRRPDDTYLCDDAILSQLKIPPVPHKRGNDRMTIRNFEAVIHVTSPTTCSTRLVANLDPNIPFLSQSIIDFCMKHLAGVMLTKLQGAARKIVKNPVSNYHAVSMRQQSDFYQLWLLRKFEAICTEKGWSMPSVAALSLSEEQLLQNRHYIERRTRRVNTFSGKEVVADSFSASSFQSSPDVPRRAHSDDSVSLLTSGTNASGWSVNPIARKLRERKLQQQRKKASHVAQTRQRVAFMMQPISFEQRERLEELRSAKLRQRGPSNPAEIYSSAQADSWWQQNLTKFFSHSRRTRFLVTLCLIIALFLVLHPELFLKTVLAKLESPERTSWVHVLWDIGTALYILLCGVLHFLTCDIALIYAFGALDLGSKAGRQVKSHYIQNVQMGTAACSLGIMASSIMKAIAQVYLPRSLWYLHKLLLRVGDAVVSGTDLLPPSMSNTLGSCSKLAAPWARYVWNTFMVALSWFGLYPAKMARLYLVQSHPIGRFVDGSFSCILNVILGVIQKVYDVVYEWATVHSTGDMMGHILWRNAAFSTAKILYLYTSIFLLTTLVLFNIFARRFRTGQSSDGAGQEALGMGNSLDSMSSPPSDSAGSSERRTHQTIQRQITDHQVSDLSATTSMRRRRFLGAFRGTFQSSDLLQDTSARPENEDIIERT